MEEYGLNIRGEWANQDTQNRHAYNTKEEVNRDLKSIHIVFITVSGVLGAGLYVRSGTMLEVGGPAAVIIPYALLSLLAWSVMQCIGEMLIIWPVSNALVLFVREFVDQELGTVVGVAYWFTYSVGFSSLLTAGASEAAIWSCSKAVQGILFLALPLIVWPVVNLFGVKYYGIAEVAGGSCKLVCAAVIFVFMILINRAVGPDSKVLGFTYWNDFFATNPAEVQNWGVAFFIALQTGAFSFIGIEIPAVTALEAKMDIPVSVLNQTSDQNIGRWPITTARKALWWACARLPLFVGPLYLIMGLLATVNVDRANPALQTLGNEVAANANIEHCAKVDSIFVISAMDSSIAHLHDVFTAFVLLTAWTSANTALYVSSRTLYGLTCNYKYLPVDEDWPRWYACLWNFRVWVGTTWTTFHHKSIPIPALIVSTVVFCWVPFLQLARVTTTTQILYVLTELGSVFCVLVWACECYAFRRFRLALWDFRSQINGSEDFRDLRRFTPSQEQAETGPGDTRDLYPWRTKLQPFHAWFGMIGCTVIVIAAGGARLWHGWRSGAPVSFIAAYLPVILFFSFWLFLKFKNCERKWTSWFPPGIRSNWENGFLPVLEALHSNRAQRLARG